MGDYIKDLRALVGHRRIMMPAAAVVVMNEKGEVLLQHRTDSHEWGIPGGAIEMGESFEDAAKRELLEETGLAAEELEFLALLSGEDFYHTYPNDDEVYIVTTVHLARSVHGSLSMDDGESDALRYFALEEIRDLQHVSEQIYKNVKAQLYKIREKMMKQVR